MTMVKRLVKHFFSLFGYELAKIQENKVTFDTFRNLADAYELLLSTPSSGANVMPDEIRPKLLVRLLGTQPSEAYCIVEALAKTRGVDGDVCEFGVAQGETAALVANEIARTNKVLHLFDSFEGLSQPTEKDHLKDDIFSLGGMEAYAGTMAYPETLVRSRLRAVSFPANRYIIHKGFVENSLHLDKNLPRHVSFAYVDFDLYHPISVALNFLHGVTPQGAIIVVDDYDFFSTGGKVAVDEFINEQDPKHEKYKIHVPNRRLGHFIVLTKVKHNDS